MSEPGQESDCVRLPKHKQNKGNTTRREAQAEDIAISIPVIRMSVILQKLKLLMKHGS